MKKRGEKILDACCGSRMFWFDRENPDVIFADNREVETTLCDGRTLLIKNALYCHVNQRLQVSV